MGTTKFQRTPKSAKKSGKERSRPNVGSDESSAAITNPSVNELAKSPKTPTRQRKAASEFASKKTSTKKRRRIQDGGKKEASRREQKQSDDDAEGDEASVDDVLRQVVELMKSKSTNAKAKALAEALKRADEAFQNDTSGGSSSVEEGPIDGAQGSEGDAALSTAKRHEESSKKDKVKSSTNTPQQRKKTVKESRLSEKRGKMRKDIRKEEESGDDNVDPVRHKAEIEALKRDDPDFFKFLEENDGSLLDFDMSDESEPEEETDISGRQHEVAQDPAEEDSEGGDEKKLKANREKELSRGIQRIDADAESGSALEEDPEAPEGSAPESETSMSDKSDDDDSQENIPSERANNGHVDDSMRPIANGKNTSIEPDHDIAGYSDDDDDDVEAEAEAEAAVEAGLQVQNESDSDVVVTKEEKERGSRKTSRKLILVDMKYLRQLRELLKSKRSSLKACKDLLRLLRAGRDILPSSPVTKTKKAKQAKGGKKSSRATADRGDLEMDPEDADGDVYQDDGSFSSGNVKFASSKSYQQAMNLAIIGIQDALDRMLGKPARKEDAIEPLEITWDPTESGRWMNLEPIFRPYVFHLLALCDATKDAETLRFLLMRLERLVPYTRENKVLLKKISKVALHVWSSDPRHIGQTTRLRSYVLLTRLAHGPGNAETVLRACCNTFSSNVANVCNPRTLPLIHFTTSCLVELFGIDMGASYTTAFSYLREMAISLRAVLVAKDRKQEVERIHNWSYINKLRLLSKILGRYGSEQELRPLIYPYVQISIGIMRAYPTPRTIPLRLHVASYLCDLTTDTGVFIPVVPHLLLLLRCSELKKKAAHGDASALEWRSLLRVSDEMVKTKPFLTGLINGAAYHIAKYFSIISKHVSFPEIAHFAVITLKKTAKGLLVSEWRQKLTDLAEKINETGDIINDARSNADLSPHGAIHPDGMLAIVPGMDMERKMPIKRLFDVEHARVVKEEKLRDEKDSMKKSRKNEDVEEDDGRENDTSEAEGSGSSDEEQGPPSKKKKLVKNVRGNRAGALSVPQVTNSSDEGDELGELSFDSSDQEE